MTLELVLAAATLLWSASAESNVVINGKALSAAEVAQLSRQYQIRPRPGRYWYDSKSGLVGIEGYGAFGFMHPGHDFGILKSTASAGKSGVFVNRRQLPEAERRVWSKLLGTPIRPGRYWLDGQGNAGYEGNPTPLVNLYVAVQQSGARTGGDGFWTSRFSAGNSRGNQGYVSVPGYGPVGYGF